MKEYYGNYLGIVVSKQDPEARGRVKVYIPHIMPVLNATLLNLFGVKSEEVISFNSVGGNLAGGIPPEAREYLEKILPFSEPASPLIGNSAPGILDQLGNYIQKALGGGDYDKNAVGTGNIGVVAQPAKNGVSSSHPLNGRMDTNDPSQLVPIGGGHYLNPYVAEKWNQLKAACTNAGISSITVESSYRTYATQVRLKEQKGEIAATPGRSNHGVGKALDLSWKSYDDYVKFTSLAKSYGFSQIPKWLAGREYIPYGNSEYWHWEIPSAPMGAGAQVSSTSSVENNNVAAAAPSANTTSPQSPSTTSDASYNPNNSPFINDGRLYDANGNPTTISISPDKPTQSAASQQSPSTTSTPVGDNNSNTTSEAPWNNVRATDFADATDIANFKACKALGKTDSECFKTGDNGIGAWGTPTSSNIPMCALPKKDWQHLANPNGTLVEVQANGKTVICELRDSGPSASTGAGLDLNPGAVAALGLTHPVSVSAKWRFSDGSVSAPAGQAITTTNNVPSTYDTTNVAKGVFSVPSEGALLWCFFREGNPLFPVYFAAAYRSSEWSSIHKSASPGFGNDPELMGESAVNKTTMLPNKGGGLIAVEGAGVHEVSLVSYAGSHIKFNENHTMLYSADEYHSHADGNIFDVGLSNRETHTKGISNTVIDGDCYIKVGNVTDSNVHKTINEIEKLIGEINDEMLKK